LRLSREGYRAAANRTGFLPEILEKVVRLGELLGVIFEHPFLRSRVLLKGGTALNLMVEAPRRLSVDIDMNYIGAVDREGMLAEKPKVLEALQRLSAGLGYGVVPRTGDHAGGGFILTYTNSLGTPDRVEIDISFTTRIPLAAPFECRIWQPDRVDRPMARLCAREELVAGKLRALVDRVAARDVYDTTFLPSLGDAPWPSQHQKRLFVFYSGTLPQSLNSYSADRIDRLTDQEVRSSLVPMLSSGSAVDTDQLKAHAKQILSPMLRLDDEELAFVNALNDGELRPDLLFPLDSELAERLSKHPHLLWKAQNAKAHKRKSV